MCGFGGCGISFEVAPVEVLCILGTPCGDVLVVEQSSCAVATSTGRCVLVKCEERFGCGLLLFSP